MENNDDLFLENIGGQPQLLSAALGASISGTIIVDWLQQDNPIVYCNKAFEDMTGYNHDEIIGRNCRFLQGENRGQVGRYKLKEAFAKENECHVELVNYRKDGTAFYNELYVAPIRNHAGVVTHYIGVQNDITIRKQQEISLLLELSNSKKLQQQKDEFTSLASHELRTPLTSLRATLQLMNRIIREDQVENERLAALSTNAERHTKKLNRLVDDLLLTTVLTHEQLVLNKTTFTVADLVESCCAQIAVNGTHTIHTAGDLNLKVHADQYKIDQVMINLLDNAVKHVPESKDILLDVGHTGNSIKIAVTDKGRGIAAEQLPEIFLRYKKVSYDPANQSGLGLGLFICSEIVKGHGGEIGVESKTGEGSRFWFTLPDMLN
jgi:PAS domain S-box-containing protein